MNRPDDLERDLVAWMRAVAPPRAPDHLAPAVLSRTRSTRPRATWLARLLEPAMHTQLSLRQVRILGLPALLVLVALIVLALSVGLVGLGSQLLSPRILPPPFGAAGNGLIAVNVDGSVGFLEPDGTGFRGLDLPFEGLSNVTFSRDGTRFAAWARTDLERPVDTELALIVAKADGSGAVDVDPSRRFTDPGVRLAWSPDGGRIAFSADRGRLYIVDVDARSVAVIETAGTARTDPTWSPDGRLAYRCQPPVGLRLCVMNADGTGEQVLPTSAGTEFAFQGSAWSPDGSRIAYYVDDVDGSGGWDVATLELGTNVERILTRSTAEHTIYPNWAVDGTHVMFTTAAGPGIVAADGSNLRILQQPDCGLVEPSPDGRFATCLLGDRLLLWPIAGGDPTELPLGRTASGFSWQRVAP